MMTHEQLQAEFWWYYRAGLRDLPHVVKNANDIYGETSQSARACIAECTFYHERGRLPSWATVIERVEVVGDDFLFVHVGDSV